MQPIANAVETIKRDMQEDLRPGIPYPNINELKRKAFERVTLAQLDPSHHPKVAAAIEAARTWMRMRSEGNHCVSLVLVAGPDDKPGCTGYGCGKTHIARACLHSLCYVVDEKPVAAAGSFFVADELVQRIEEGVFISRLIGITPIVVVDDVGAEQTIPYVSGQSQDWERQVRYFKLINYCYTNAVSLVLTGNLTFEGMREVVGGRAWSRLREMTPQGLMVDLTGVSDYRLKLRDEEVCGGNCFL